MATSATALTTALQAGLHCLSTPEAENCIRSAGPIFCVLPGSTRPPQSTVSFALRPPSFVGEDIDTTFGLAVFTEWRKKESGSLSLECGANGAFPNLTYSESKGTFTLDLTRSNCNEPVLRNALFSLAAEALQEAVARHLTEGGDERLHVSTSGNKYYCSPRPVPDAVIRGTCTCSPPSRNSFNAACARLDAIWNGVESFDEAFDDIRRRISAALSLRTRHHIILHPSGTDAEYTPLLIATLAAKSLSCSGVINIVVGVGEVGSNTPHAAGGNHFSEFVPICKGSSGKTPTPSTLVRDDSSLPDGTTVLELKARLPDGSLLPGFDTLVANAIIGADNPSPNTSSGAKPFFILHAVDGSKLGNRITSRKLVTDIQSRLGNRVLVVLDACQGRTESDELDWYLSRGAVVLMTASKFYSAPGFCGMAVVPDIVAGGLKGDGIKGMEVVVPEGLGDYLTQPQVPKELAGFRAALPAKPVNVGLFLRWACGVMEMERFARAGGAAREGIRRWVLGARELMAREYEWLELMPEVSGEGGHASQLGGVNSILAFKLLDGGGRVPLKTAALKQIHRWLTTDVAALLPDEATEEERNTAKLNCFIGQPVDLGDFAVLRFAIGAALAAELGEDPGFLDTALREDARILEKIGVLLKYHEVM
ncbi:hypothetical protein B0T18DRAFT_487103 [Schizothecium vesticola]|uniref:Uncharacterized protein n=1 Tax=Schizothecium vesticola TaxID=314040 RepID=A0AA40K7R8_9PEZI|nr:hypothetical protein B0T18DRAFT_487103 [Schizothecium vesticola]